MSIKRKIKIFINALKNLTKKKQVISKVFYVLKTRGLLGIKETIIKISTPKQEYIIGSTPYDLLEAQQSKVDKEKIKKEISKLPYTPLISIILLADETVGDINGVLESIDKQLYQTYEVIVLAPESGMIFPTIQAKFLQSINIIKYTGKYNGSILNNIIEKISGEYLMFLEADCVLTKNCLFEYAKYVNTYDYDLLYADSCVNNFQDNIVETYRLLPEYSKVLLYHINYMGYNVLLKKTTIQHVGGFAYTYTNLKSLIYNIILKICDYSSNIGHIEEILVIINSSIKLPVQQIEKVENIKTVKDFHRTKGIAASVIEGKVGLEYIEVGYSPKVTIIIPVNEIVNINLLIERLLLNTAYRDYEIILVINNELTDIETQQIVMTDMVKLCKYNGIEDFSSRCNKGAEQATGEILVFLQECIEIVEPMWLQRLINNFVFNQVGASSPKILRKDNTIQYAGMIAGGYGISAIPYNGEQNTYKGEYNSSAFLTREVSILSSTCFAVHKEVFFQVGGFDNKNTPDKFANVDLSFRIQQEGYKCVFAASSELFSTTTDWYDSWYLNGNNKAYAYIVTRWAKELSSDPYFTESMKVYMLKNVPIEYKIFGGEQGNVSHKRNKRRVLLITHELSITGAPVALHFAAKSILNNGDIPVILSPCDGNLRTTIVNDGITVMVDPSMLGSDMFIDMALSFDIIIVSTLVMYQVIEKLSGKDIPVMWWVHESKESYALGADRLIPQSIEPNIHVYCGGEYAKKMLLNSRKNYDAGVLLYGVSDFANHKMKNEEKQKDKLVFATIGTVERRKGQDLFADAILRLPSEYIQKCIFLFIGRNIHADIYSKILKAKERYPENVTLINEVSREKLMTIYNECDCVVCASRDDPMPVFMTEAMMFSKVCICSENTGTAALLKDKENGFVFTSDDSEHLLEKIKYVIENNDKLDTIRRASRKTYENYFSMEVFNKNVSKVLDTLMKKGDKEDEESSS